jgi:hypothetical protein
MITLLLPKKYFKTDVKTYIFYILWQVNLFYGMQSKFQNKVDLPKRHAKSIS